MGHDFFKYWVWCFPQTFIGFLLIKLWETRKHQLLKNVIVYSVKNISPFALGRWIFIPKDYINQKVYNHELGHCKQSDMLGWLYLPTVGLVSVFWNIVSRYSTKARLNYYNRWPENWADKLGGVKR